jgi:hypothetical protein
MVVRIVLLLGLLESGAEYDAGRVTAFAKEVQKMGAGVLLQEPKY